MVHSICINNFRQIVLLKQFDNVLRPLSQTHIIRICYKRGTKGPTYRIKISESILFYRYEALARTCLAQYSQKESRKVKQKGKTVKMCEVCWLQLRQFPGLVILNSKRNGIKWFKVSTANALREVVNVRDLEQKQNIPAEYSRKKKQKQKESMKKSSKSRKGKFKYNKIFWWQFPEA